jgi:tape measure domain-containing protein
MASNRIGALYAEVILDPRGYSRGVSKVQSEQKILAAAIKDTTTPIERLQAEIDSIDSLFDKLAAKEPFEGQDLALDALINKTQLLADEMQRLEDLPAKQAEAENIKLAEAEHKEKLKREEELKKKQQETLNFMRAGQERRKREEEKRAADELQAIKDAEDAENRRVEKMIKDFYYLEGVKAKSRKMEQDAIKEEERLKKKAKADEIAREKRITDLQSQRAINRLKEFQYIQKFGVSSGLPAAFQDMKKAITEINGGLSKMAGNLAQAAGMSPAMQGLARVLGSIGLKAVGIGFGLAMFVKTGIASVKAAEKLRMTLVRLKNALGGNELMADALNRQLEELSIRAGVSADSTRELGKSLITMGISPGDVEGTAKMIAMLSEGDPTKMQSIAKAYTDTMSKTRLMGQEALQFANAGVPIYLRLQKITGKTKAEVTKMMESGEITVELLDKALQLQTEMIGGDEVFEENMESITGLTNKMSQSIRHIKEIIGEPFRQVFVMALKPVSAIVGFVEQQFVTLQHMFRDVEVPILRIFNVMERIEKARQGEMNWIEALDPIGGVALGRNIMEIALGRRQLEYDTLQLKMKMEATAKRTQAALDEELRIEKERSENFQDQMQYMNDQLLTEEQLRDTEFERLIMSQKFTGLQIKQLRNRYYEIEAEKKRRKEEEEAEKKREKAKEEISDKLKSDLEIIDKQTKERQREAEAEAEKSKSKIEKNLTEKESDFDKAAGMAGTSFGAGSVAEYQFMRNLRMQDLKAAKQEQFEKKAAEERSKINANLANLIKAISQDADLASNHAQLSFEGAMSNLP